MQLLPTTGKAMQVGDIKTAEANIHAGAKYMDQLMERYFPDAKFSEADRPLFAFAGYNAGPGRAREWIKEFGDPRDAKVDPIDWIHRIPFEETRDYVQKVLSNIQIYRARLGEEANAVRLNADLRRLSTAAGGTESTTAVK